MIPKQVFVFIGLFVLFLQSAFAQHRTTPANKLDSVAQQAGNHFISQRGRVGLSIGILYEGKTSFYHFGSIRKDKRLLPTQHTLYEIGSITKTFTSLLLAQAVAERKVSLEDDIRTYLDGTYDNLTYEGQPIRLVHLANTTSGLPDNFPDQSKEFQRANPDSVPFLVVKALRHYTKQDFLTDLHQAKLTSTPGLTPSHSNVASQLLGYILERIYQTPYEVLISQFIEKPLSMNTKTMPQSSATLLAMGYNEKGHPMPPLAMKTVQAAGGLRYSTADMLKYVAFHLNEVNERVRLSHQITWGSIDEVGIGSNWSISKTIDSQRRLQTSGGTFGFSSYCALYPDQQLGLVLLSNEADQSAQYELQEISSRLTDALLGTPPALTALQQSLEKQDYQDAITIVNQLRQQYPQLHLTEEYVNNWGYALINKGKLNQALEIFKLNVSLYPNNFNTYDSLAETYEQLGNVELAIQNYQRALSLNPGSTHAMECLKKLNSRAK